MSCYSSQILDLFYNIQYTGRIIKPEAVGRAGSEAEGTVIEFSWRVKDEKIEDARFRTLGDVNAIAISSILTSMVIGKTIDEALNISAEDILEHLRDQKPNYLYITDLALEALTKTYENYLKKNIRKEKVNNQTEFSRSLQSNIEKLENGEFIDNFDSELDLSNLSATEIEDDDEYLSNLQQYENTVNENNIEKSLKSLIGEDEVVREKQDRRGRPRKERTLEELELMNAPKKGRGRPRKERTEEELAKLNEPKKSRGRPRKERTPEELEALNQPKKGRGRPRKDVISLTEQNFINNDFEEVDDELENEFANDVFSQMSRTENYSQPVNSFTNNFYNENIEDEIEDDEFDDFEDEEIDEFAQDMEEVESEIKVENNTNFSNEIDGETENEYSAYENQPVIRGRGRPRKERTPEELEKLNRPKLSRGRPRKERTEEELAKLNEPKKSRGRPRKERTPEELEALNQPKKSRGRPRKEISVDNDPNSNEEGVLIVRGRGRPRKDRTEEELAKLNEPKKSRGRPRKERTEEELAKMNQPKKSRGRPRKTEEFIFSNDFNNDENEAVDNSDDILNNSEEYTQSIKKIFKENTTPGDKPAGRGRPRKERTEEELAKLDAPKKSRGRPRKEDVISIQTISPANDEKVESEKAEEVKTPEVEVEENFVANQFAPAQNKYGVGVKPNSSKMFTVKHVKTSTISYYSDENKKVVENSSIQHTKKIETNIDENGNITETVEEKREELPKKETQKPLEEKTLKEYLEDDTEPTSITPLSSEIDKILSNGGSVEDALKALLEDN